jgi:hypothetical protein
MYKVILLTFLLSSFASASSDRLVRDLAQKHFPFEIDIDGDYHKDLFITDSRGNEGAPYKVFLNMGKDYVLIGEVFVRFRPMLKSLLLLNKTEPSLLNLNLAMKQSLKQELLKVLMPSGKEKLNVPVQLGRQVTIADGPQLKLNEKHQHLNNVPVVRMFIPKSENLS